MQPRPCDCSPMCLLRATNPARIHQIRGAVPTFAATSPYWLADLADTDLAARLTRYAVLANDPAVPAVAADYWQHSERFYRAVVAELEAIVAADPAVRSAYRNLADNPTDVAAERLLEARLAAVLAADPGLGAAASRRLDAADDNVYINYFRGRWFSTVAPEIGPDRLVSLASRRGSGRESRRAGGRDEILVVIPLMEREGTGRIRNLLACLLALKDQTFPAERYRVTVVEFDTVPRWRHVVAPLVDHYVHIYGSGLFNKSWTLNVGVRHSPRAARTVCLLDGDILVDRQFLERNHARFADPSHDAHIPHTETLSLDTPSSDRAIEQRCMAGAAEARLGDMRGLLLRDGPGGCLWTRTEIFHRVGGLDERYSGWGGEDEDMLVRTAAAGAATQCDDIFVHLAHPRPPMRRSDGRPFNAHIELGSWTGSSGYGLLAGPALASTG